MTLSGAGGNQVGGGNSSSTSGNYSGCSSDTSSADSSPVVLTGANDDYKAQGQGLHFDSGEKESKVICSLKQVAIVNDPNNKQQLATNTSSHNHSTSNLKTTNDTQTLQLQQQQQREAAPHQHHKSSSSGSVAGSSSSNVTAFLSKLWRMVNDNHNGDLIRWSQSGCSFVIINQIQFAKDLLPLYFKHSNMASFIRQLNMYGFRKIPLMGANGTADQRIDVAQFYHVNFMRGQEQRLSSIKRKNNASKTHSLVVNGSFCDEVRAILTDVKSIRDGQNSSESILGALQVDNKSLWRDVAVLRSQHHKQRRVVEKLIQFLLSLIQNRNSMVKKRKMKFIISQDDLNADLPMDADDDDDNNSGPGSMEMATNHSLDEMGLRGDDDCGAAGSNQAANSSRMANEPTTMSTYTAALAGESHQTNGQQRQAQQSQLFELGAAVAMSPTTSSSSPVLGHLAGSHSVFNGASGCASTPSTSGPSPLMSLCQSAVIAASRADQMSGLSEDELVPGGGTAASTTAAALAAAAAAAATVLPASTPISTSNINLPAPRQLGNYLSPGGARGSECAPKPTPLTPTTSATAVANNYTQRHLQLSAMGQENINITGGNCSPPTRTPSQQHLRDQQRSQLQQSGGGQQVQHHHQPHHHHHQHHQHQQQQHQQHQQQQQQHQSQTNGQQLNSGGYLTAPLQFQTGGPSTVSGVGVTGHHNNHHQQRQPQQNLHLATNNGQQFHRQHHNHHQSQQQRLHGAHQSQLSRIGSGNTTPLGNVAAQGQANSIASRLDNCQHMSQWTANSIYNTMAQQDLGGGSGGLHGTGPDGFSASGMFNELRMGPSSRFLSAALEQQHQQAGATANGHLLPDTGGAIPSSILGNSTGRNSANSMISNGRPTGSSASGANQSYY